MSKRDDDFIDPFKLIINFFKVVFKIIELVFKSIKLIYDGLTSPNKITSIGTALFVLLVIASIGSCVYISSPEMQGRWSGVSVPIHMVESLGTEPGG